MVDRPNRRIRSTGKENQEEVGVIRALRARITPAVRLHEPYSNRNLTVF